jgi:hypothetical protein
MESELVAGLCEIWFIISLWSKWTLSRVLGLIQYKNNNLIILVDILSGLYWNYIKYANNIMNPYNGYLGYKKLYYYLITLLYDRCYTWTSKILDPSERYTPCIDTFIRLNNLFIIKPGSSIFKYYWHHDVNNLIKGNNETIARSNKGKFIISEKSRKQILLGCKGNTFLEKIDNYFLEWSNYYVIRCCNSAKILLECHSKSKINECEETLRGEDLPMILLKFLNNNINLNNYFTNIENHPFLKQDVEIDKLTELYSYYNGQYIHIDSIYKYNILNEKYFLINNDKEVKMNKLMQFTNKKHEFSNITQNYFYCNNKAKYVGWVCVIRIKNFSSQPTYYNNLIKRYHKEWKEILTKWIIVPNLNLKCNSITKICNYLKINNNIDKIRFRRVKLSLKKKYIPDKKRIPAQELSAPRTEHCSRRNRVPWYFKWYHVWETFIKDINEIPKKFR